MTSSAYSNANITSKLYHVSSWLTLQNVSMICHIMLYNIKQ